MKALTPTAVLLAIVATTPTLAANENASATERTIENLTNQWVAAWNIGDGAFNTAPFLELFAAGDKGITVFDNVQGDLVVITDVETYAETWAPFMEPLTHWSVKLDDLSVTTSGDLAYTTFKLVGTDTRGPNGEIIPFGQYGTHVWQNLPDQGWRIVHEHLTSYDLERERQER